MDLEVPETWNDYANEHQQQFNRPTDFESVLRQAVCKQSSVSTSQRYRLVASESQTRPGVAALRINETVGSP
jgi:hypothetical protein